MEGGRFLSYAQVFSCKRTHQTFLLLSLGKLHHSHIPFGKYVRLISNDLEDYSLKSNTNVALSYQGGEYFSTCELSVPVQINVPTG